VNYVVPIKYLSKSLIAISSRAGRAPEVISWCLLSQNKFQIKEANYEKASWSWPSSAPSPWRCENRCRLQSKKRQVKASGVTLWRFYQFPPIDGTHSKLVYNGPMEITLSINIWSVESPARREWVIVYALEPVTRCLPTDKAKSKRDLQNC